MQEAQNDQPIHKYVDEAKEALNHAIKQKMTMKSHQDHEGHDKEMKH